MRFSPYYPISSLSSANQFVSNDYKFNGIEMIDDLGLNMLDYGARLYDPLIGRWNGVDALAERYASSGTYNYVLGNPILMVDPDGMRNMVYVVFLQSSGLNTAQKSAVIAEMQRIYDDVIGLRDERCQPIVKVREFSESLEGKMNGQYLDNSDVVVAIGSVGTVNQVRSRVGYSRSQINGDATYFEQAGLGNPELSQQKVNNQNFGKFVGLASDRILHANGFLSDVRSNDRQYGRKLSTASQIFAYLAVHGSGHNAGHLDGVYNYNDIQLKRDGGGYYTVAVPHSIHNQIMAYPDVLFSEGLSYVLNPGGNGNLYGFFRDKFHGASPKDNYQYNKRNNISTPIR